MLSALMKAFRISFVLLIAYVAFISLGLPDSVLGIAWPSIRKSFGLQLAELGPIFLVSTAGYLVASVNSGKAVGRFGVGLVLAFSSLITALSLLGDALSPFWWVMISWSFISGLGAGAVDSALNTFVATNFSKRHVSWLHACWGVGASTGPVIMTAFIGSGASWRWGYVAIMLIQALLTIGFFATTRHWVLHHQAATPAPVEPTVARRRETLRLPMTWLSIGVFFIYCGVEAMTGQWMYSVLVESRMVSAITAGLWISIYWGSLTAGRFLIGAIANHIAPLLLVRLSMAGALAGLGLTALPLRPEFCLFGLVLTGFSLASIFPSLISTTPQRLASPHVPNAVGFQVGGASLGLAILPGLAGILAQQFGLEIIPFFLIAATLGMILLHEGIVRQAHRMTFAG
ncbi:MAG: MFS transporter [Lentisphaerota bacterium]